MKLAALILLVTVPAIAQTPPAPAKTGDVSIQGCSSDVQPSGFTGCQELRIKDYLNQMAPYQEQLAKISADASAFIQRIESANPGMVYQPSAGQAFPYGRLVPKPKDPPPTPPAAATTPKPEAKK